MSNIVNFTLLVAGYFNIFTKSLELYFGKQFNYLKTVYCLYLSRLLHRTRVHVSEGLIVPRYEGRTESVLPRLWSLRLYRPDGRSRHCSQPVQGPTAVPLALSESQCFPASAGLLTHSHAWLSALPQAPGASRVFLMGSLLSGICASSCGPQVSPSSQLCLLSAIICQPVSPCSLSHSLDSPSRQWGKATGGLTSFICSHKGHYPLLLYIHCLENGCFIFSLFCCCCCQMGG